MTTYKFTTPVVEEGPSGDHRLFYFFKLNRGVSVAKANGAYFTVRWPSEDAIALYQEFYLGGHEHSVSQATRDALIAADIGIDETNFVAE